LLIRREISSAGRNRIFINNSLATLSALKQVGDNLADIHGQQEQRSLLNLSTHRDWLDFFGQNLALKERVGEHYQRLKETERQLLALESDEQERLRRIDILRFQAEEIRRAEPKPNEKEALESERSVQSNREKILSLASEAYLMLYESESSILKGLNRLEKILEELERFDKVWASHHEILKESRYKLEDIAYTIRDYTADSDFAPERLEQIEQRLYELEKLEKKYGSSSVDILQYLENCSNELEELEEYEQSSSLLSEQLSTEITAYELHAGELSEKRQRDARLLEKEIRSEFSALAMERMKMRVDFPAPGERDAQRRIPSHYGLGGIDHVEFLIAPNEGEAMRPLAKIASGGELSRLMLAIKSLCGNDDAARTLVFDEVDAGIGGRAAEAVGKRLLNLSKDNQVFCVTHLPQIASFAHRHFHVMKGIVSGRTETMVRALDEAERIEEIARMLGGKSITKTTRQHAMEMLEHASPQGKRSMKQVKR
jgi:DNA repair protein RecN (Recombination protein N)